jgi:hypothetical protein
MFVSGGGKTRKLKSLILCNFLSAGTMPSDILEPRGVPTPSHFHEDIRITPEVTPSSILVPHTLHKCFHV